MSVCSRHKYPGKSNPIRTELLAPSFAIFMQSNMARAIILKLNAIQSNLYTYYYYNTFG